MLVIVVTIPSADRLSFWNLNRYVIRRPICRRAPCIASTSYARRCLRLTRDRIARAIDDAYCTILFVDDKNLIGNRVDRYRDWEGADADGSNRGRPLNYGHRIVCLVRDVYLISYRIDRKGMLVVKTADIVLAHGNCHGGVV